MPSSRHHWPSVWRSKLCHFQEALGLQEDLRQCMSIRKRIRELAAQHFDYSVLTSQQTEQTWDDFETQVCAELPIFVFQPQREALRHYTTRFLWDEISRFRQRKAQGQTKELRRTVKEKMNTHINSDALPPPYSATPCASLIFHGQNPDVQGLVVGAGKKHLHLNPISVPSVQTSDCGHNAGIPSIDAALSDDRIIVTSTSTKETSAQKPLFKSILNGTQANNASSIHAHANTDVPELLVNDVTSNLNKQSSGERPRDPGSALTLNLQVNIRLPALETPSRDLDIVRNIHAQPRLLCVLELHIEKRSEDRLTSYVPAAHCNLQVERREWYEMNDGERQWVIIEDV